MSVIKKSVSAIAYGGFYIVALSLSRLPLSVLYLLSDLMSFVIHRIVRYRLKVVRTNLRNSFPDKPAEELRTIEKRFYLHFCDYCIELLKLMHISEEELGRRLKVENMELLDKPFSENKSIIMLMGHYGNWDWLTTLHSKLYPGTVLAAVYRPLKNRYIDEYFIRIRQRFETLNISKYSTLRSCIRIKQSGKPHLIAMISDQSPSKNSLDYWTTFMHQDTAVLTGMERIARQLGFEVYYLDMKQIKRGYYTCTLSLVTDEAAGLPEYAVSEMFVRHLEQTIEHDPALYLWTHKRWKHKRDLNKRDASES
jgi:KDO2-lipid IV(A) lauroyltransferase